MADEVEQINEEIFTRILLGIVTIGLITSMVIVLTDGFASPWFVRAMALVVIAAIVFILRLFGQFVVAGYGLVLALIGLTGEIFLNEGALTGFPPYLLIPIVLIAGILLNPLATLAITIFSILTTLLIITFSGQMSSANLGPLLVPIGLTLLVALLSAASKRYFNNLGKLLLENRMLLKARTLQLMGTRQQIEDLQKFQKEQEKSKIKESQRQGSASRKGTQLYELVMGTVQELNSSIDQLEHVFEQIGEQVDQAADGDSLESVWPRIDSFRTLTINLSEMAQLEYGRIELNYQAVDVGRLIGEVVGIAQGLVRGKELEIRYQIPSELPTIQADPVRLRQVLLHLLHNAIQYTDQGIIEMEAEPNEHEIKIFVSDTGIGMHREERDLIFEKFGRGSGTLAQQRQGAGLGLAICKRLIELHGGQMWVNSALGYGSTFYLTLPLETIRERSQIAATLIDRGLVKMPVRTAQPVAVETAREREAEVRPTLPALSPTRPPDNDKATIISKPSQTMIAHLVQPIHRYGPTYIRRFGFILLGILLSIIIVVAGLAIMNYTTGQGPFAAQATAPASSLLADGATDVAATATTMPEEIIGQTPTHTASSTPQPTHTPTKAPPTPTTAAATVTPFPTPQTVSTSSPTGTPSPPPTATDPPATPTVTIQPAISSPSQLSFVTEQSQGPNRFGVDFGDNSDPEVVIETIGNSRLSWSRTGQILFASDQGGDRDIFVTTPDNGRPIKLTTAVGDDLQPSWSPDGQKIAFSSGRTGNFEIYVMDADGSNLIQLTSSRGFDEWPVWSPDGQSIAFVSDRAGNVDLYTMNVDGSNLQQLTTDPADDWPAAWSPDGRSLVFASERDDSWNLYLIPADGGSPIRLTNAPGSERDPVWSPEGQSIAFAYDGSGNWDIYTLPVPAGSITEVPPTAWIQITNSPIDERYPIWR